MENQHRKITGYRDLGQAEIDLMNKVKALGPLIEEVLIEIEAHVQSQRKDSRIHGGIPSVDARMDNATPERFLELASTEMQTGLMYATRAVAQPEFF